jgi:hypothetical protein
MSKFLEKVVFFLLNAALKPRTLQWALWLGFGLCSSGFESCQDQETFRRNDQILSGRTPGHLFNGNRASSGREGGHSPLSVPRLKISGSVPPLPLRPLRVYRNNSIIIYIYIYIYIYTQTYTYMDIHNAYIRMYVRTYVHTYIHTKIRTYVHTNIRTYIQGGSNMTGTICV